MMIHKKGCRYTIMRFCPDFQTDEFINIGVILTCPQIGFFDFKVDKTRSKRFQSFFSQVKESLYVSAVKNFTEELITIQQRFANTRSSPEKMRLFFEQFVHPREALIQLSPARALLHHNPTEAVSLLFEQLVTQSPLKVNNIFWIPHKEKAGSLVDEKIQFPMTTRFDKLVIAN